DSLDSSQSEDCFPAASRRIETLRGGLLARVGKHGADAFLCALPDCTSATGPNLRRGTQRGLAWGARSWALWDTTQEELALCLWEMTRLLCWRRTARGLLLQWLWFSTSACADLSTLPLALEDPLMALCSVDLLQSSCLPRNSCHLLTASRDGTTGQRFHLPAGGVTLWPVPCDGKQRTVSSRPVGVSVWDLLSLPRSAPWRRKGRAGPAAARAPACAHLRMPTLECAQHRRHRSHHLTPVTRVVACALPSSIESVHLSLPPRPWRLTGYRDSCLDKLMRPCLVGFLLASHLELHELLQLFCRGVSCALPLPCASPHLNTSWSCRGFSAALASGPLLAGCDLVTQRLCARCPQLRDGQGPGLQELRLDVLTQMSRLAASAAAVAQGTALFPAARCTALLRRTQTPFLAASIQLSRAVASSSERDEGDTSTTATSLGMAKVPSQMAGTWHEGFSRDGVPAVRASRQQGAAERQERSTEEPRSEPRGAARTHQPALRSRISHRQAAGSGRLRVPSSQVQAEPGGAMASPSGSPEDSGKLRGRDGRQRREEEDAPPEEKRLRLGLEGGSAEEEEGGDAPRLGREDTGTQTGGAGRGQREQRQPHRLLAEELRQYRSVDTEAHSSFSWPWALLRGRDRGWARLPLCLPVRAGACSFWHVASP
ncbi:hypothetical protein J0S82_012742, partial [Galemys pyrenaicus]